MELAPVLGGACLGYTSSYVRSKSGPVTQTHNKITLNDARYLGTEGCIE